MRTGAFNVKSLAIVVVPAPVLKRFVIPPMLVGPVGVLDTVEAALEFVEVSKLRSMFRAGVAPPFPNIAPLSKIKSPETRNWGLFAVPVMVVAPKVTGPPPSNAKRLRLEAPKLTLAPLMSVGFPCVSTRIFPPVVEVMLIAPVPR